MDVFSILQEQPQLFPMVRALERVRDLAHPPINRMVTVHFVHGLTGTGKTFWANQKWPGAYMKPAGPWWDNYNYESTVILDDVDEADMPRAQWLRVLDGYPLQVPYKGGYRSAYYTRVVITSNYPPDVTFAKYWDGAFKRRLHKVYAMDHNPPVTQPCPLRVELNKSILARLSLRHVESAVWHDIRVVE